MKKPKSTTQTLKKKDTAEQCAQCEMPKDEWSEKRGYTLEDQTYCCEGCATGSGCTC